MLIALIAAAAAAAPPDMVMLDEPVLTRAKAARLLGARPVAGGVALRLDRSGRARIISSTALARLAGVAVPAPRRDYALVYRPEAHRIGCVATVRPIARGHVLEAADVVDASCDAGVHRLLGYDRAKGTTVAASDIAANVGLGRVALGPPAAVEEGAALTLRSSVGPVVIERQVTALQQGKPGRFVFVRGTSGPAFAVSVARVAP